MYTFFKGVPHGSSLSLFPKRFAEPVAVNSNEASRQLQPVTDHPSTTHGLITNDVQHARQSDPNSQPQSTNTLTSNDKLLSEIFSSEIEPVDKTATAAPNFTVTAAHDKHQAASLIYSFGMICHIECTGLDCVRKCKECDKAGCKETIKSVTFQQPELSTNKQKAAVTEANQVIVETISIDEAIDKSKNEEETVLERNTNEETNIMTDIDALVDEKHETEEEQSAPKLSLFSRTKNNLKVMIFSSEATL